MEKKKRKVIPFWFNTEYKTSASYRRIKPERVKKWAIGSGIVGVPLVFLIFYFLIFLQAIDITGYSGDMVCAGTLEDPCLAYINFTANTNVYIYPINESDQVWIFNTEPQVKEIEFYRSWGDGWRRINLSNPWSKRVKYAIKFSRGKDYSLKFVGYKYKPTDTIKWSFGDIDPFWYSTTQVTDLTLELGSQANVTTNISGVTQVCVDVDHPEYGINYTCGTPTANLSFNISYFRRTEFNDSTTTKNLTYDSGSAENQTVWVQGHQYDDVDNFTMNFSGYLTNGTYPQGVKVYINYTWSNTLGPLFPGTITEDELNDSSTEKNLTWVTAETETDYFNLLKEASMTSAYMNLSGFQNRNYWAYDNWNFSYAGETTTPLGFYFNETYFWATASTEEEVFRYWANGTYSGSSFDTSGETDHPADVYYNGTYFWVLGFTFTPVDRNSVFRYTSAGNYDNWFFDINRTGYTPDGGDTLNLWYNETSFWVSDENEDIVLRYNASGVYQDNFSVTDEGSGPRGITSNGTFLWVMLAGSDRVHRYWMNGTHSDWNFSTSTHASSTDVERNDTFFWIHSNGTDDKVFRYAAEYTTDPYLEVGTVDGTHEWNYTDKFNVTDNRTENFSAPITSYLSTCTADDEGYCLVPLYFVSDTAGIIQISAIEINYTYNPNPVQFNLTLVRNFLGNSSNSTNIPITIEDQQNGTITLNDIRYDYAGGNDTIEILVWNATNKSDNETMNMTVYYSKWNYDFPKYVSYLEFIPANPTSVNVTPYGQTTTTPIFNVTMYNYGNKNMNLSSYLNETHTCVNLTISGNSTKANGYLLNATWTDLFTNLSYLNLSQIWMWADYDCNYTSWRLWQPNLYFRGCCYECNVTCSTTLT